MIDDLRWKLRWAIPRALFWGSGFLRCRLIRRRPETAYLERYWLGSIFGWTFYLHRFVAPDREEEPHDTATTSAWQQSAPIGREMWRSVFGGWE